MAFVGLPPQPSIETPRLLVRPLKQPDADALSLLQQLEPYNLAPLGMVGTRDLNRARGWIASRRALYERERTAVWAVVARAKTEFLGVTGVALAPEHRRALLAFWIGSPHRNEGYATEAARAVIGCAFDALGLDRLVACHVESNDACRRVLEKLAMQREAILRQHLIVHGVAHDLMCYGILQSEWPLTKDL